MISNNKTNGRLTILVALLVPFVYGCVFNVVYSSPGNTLSLLKHGQILMLAMSSDTGKWVFCSMLLCAMVAMVGSISGIVLTLRLSHGLNFTRNYSGK